MGGQIALLCLLYLSDMSNYIQVGLIVPYSLFREKQYRDKIAVSVKVKSKKGNYLFFHK